MSNPKEAKLLDHEYDGIREFDNPLPNWWLATFYGAILFSVLYVGYYEFGSGKGSQEELAQEMEEIRNLDQAASQNEAPPTEEALLAIFQDPGRKESGHKIFTERCATCHGPAGAGLIGPNLTDNYWLHGRGSLTDLAEVISNGVLDKGMPPWKTMLKKEEIYSVVAFVKSLKGTHPANPKASQGTEFKD